MTASSSTPTPSDPSILEVTDRGADSTRRKPTFARNAWRVVNRAGREPCRKSAGTAPKRAPLERLHSRQKRKGFTNGPSERPQSSALHPIRVIEGWLPAHEGSGEGVARGSPASGGAKTSIEVEAARLAVGSEGGRLDVTSPISNTADPDPLAEPPRRQQVPPRHHHRGMRRRRAIFGGLPSDAPGGFGRGQLASCGDAASGANTLAAVLAPGDGRTSAGADRGAMARTRPASRARGRCVAAAVLLHLGTGAPAVRRASKAPEAASRR